MRRPDDPQLDACRAHDSTGGGRRPRRARLGPLMAAGLLAATVELVLPCRGASAVTAPVLATPTTRPSYRISVNRTFADGALRFEPAPDSVKIVRSRDMAVRTAKKELPSGISVPTPEVFFARYLLETSERVVSGVPKPNKELRAVWVVRFPRVDGERKSGVILRSNIPTIVPVTTIPKKVVTDIVVVVDDTTGRVLLRSEFAPEQPAGERA